MEDRSEKLRWFFASLICAAAKVSGTSIEQAFRTVKREPFAGPGPWSISLGTHDYVRTPDDDPAFLYQNALLALVPARNINIGMPGAHAYWLGACELKEGETVVQIGAGSGYYTAILAELAVHPGVSMPMRLTKAWRPVPSKIWEIGRTPMSISRPVSQPACRGRI